MNRKRIAKEWGRFLVGFFFSLLAVPLLLFHFFFFVPGGNLSEFYSPLFDKRSALVAWLLVFFPYLLFQLVRSAVWAWKTSREKQ